MAVNDSVQVLLARKWTMGFGWNAFLNYSQKNVDAMKKVYEQTDISPELAEAVKGLKREVRILTIGADWCGDCVANMPPVAKLAALNPRIEYRIVDRDRHDDLMEQFLTNGAKSIPKVILGPPNFEHYGTWGARPAACQAIMTENKGKMPKEEIIPMIRAWYDQDCGRTVLAEIWAEIQQQAK